VPVICHGHSDTFWLVVVNTWVNPDKFFLDGLELEQQVVVKQNFTDAYHLFYVAQIISRWIGLGGRTQI
jgi:hypothetical protein